MTFLGLLDARQGGARVPVKEQASAVGDVDRGTLAGLASDSQTAPSEAKPRHSLARLCAHLGRAALSSCDEPGGGGRRGRGDQRDCPGGASLSGPARVVPSGGDDQQNHGLGERDSAGTRSIQPEQHAEAGPE